MSSNLVHYLASLHDHPKMVWYTGTDVLPKGIGVFYDNDRGTATDAEGERGSNFVERGSTTNNFFFAGVTTRRYSANSAGQAIEIHEPGSDCLVAIGADTVVNVTRLTCRVSGTDSGIFDFQGFDGRGTATALQTVSSVRLEDDITGAASVDVTGLIVTDSSATFTTNGVAANDKLVVLGGGSDAGASGAITANSYNIASVDSETQVTLSTSMGTTASNITYYVLDATTPRLALMHLQEGEESGGQEWVAPIDNAAATGMVGGVTNIVGGYTITTGDSTSVLASGLYDGMRKAFECHGALTTKFYQVSTASNIAVQEDGTTALAKSSLNADGERTDFRWAGGLGVLGVFEVTHNTATLA